ncbi:uncharacterized protein LOC129772021 isoform X2 [Toxorhynchites rutilus septentrionalis]|uniref:uncharacterized protein LOC129772021 isoform X2 n=1 Tax=Toxorhynchites rutilus septentrionalis TaxID=329112 RepID=UPI00247A9931|nr:uncharacterized protein LOC129772021 isoform X2 [Toxorhynchites rutilus septentrionalis]
MQSSAADMVKAPIVDHRSLHPLLAGDKNSTRRKMVSGTNGSSWLWPLAVLVCLGVFANSAVATEEIIAIDDYHNQTISSDSDSLGTVLSNSTTAATQPEPVAARATRAKPLFSTGNPLWDALVAECIKKPTFACIQKNVYSFLGESLEVGDFNVSSRLVFTKNRVDFTKYTREANEEDHDQGDHEVDNEIPDARDFEPTSPIEEVTSALHGKTVKFMLTHDVNIQMPEMMFDGAIFRIEPRAIEGNGMLAKLEFIPKTAVESRGIQTPRILFKKIKKFFQSKLLLAFLGVLLVIKIIKIKVMWLLPLLVGVGTAKKLILKFLLFLFPAFAHIFKLCSYYHQSYHKPNFHHHQHHISHLHTVYPHDHSNHLPELIFTKPPRGHPSEYIHGAPVPPHAHFQPEFHYESSGPGLGSEIIVTKPVYGPPSSHGPGFLSTISAKRSPTGAASSIANAYVSAPTGPTTAAEEQMMREAQRQEAYRIAQEQKLIAKQQQIINHQAFVQEGVTPRPVDPFYSPILQRLEKVFNSLGIVDENCRERLVCAMYKAPVKYSPHSNYVSAELSRDATELQKPTSTNAAVVRFYRYVQAARDGQEQRDCRQIYSLCTINIDKKKK